MCAHTWVCTGIQVHMHMCSSEETRSRHWVSCLITLCLIYLFVCLFCVWCVFNRVCMWHVEARGRWPVFCFILRIICLRQDFSVNLELFCPASPCSPAVFMSSSPLLTLDWVYGWVQLSLAYAWVLWFWNQVFMLAQQSLFLLSHLLSTSTLLSRDRDCCWAES